MSGFWRARIDEEVDRAGADVVTINVAGLRHAVDQLILECHHRVMRLEEVLRELDDELEALWRHPITLYVVLNIITRPGAGATIGCLCLRELNSPLTAARIIKLKILE
jgi:hypothetical protein